MIRSRGRSIAFGGDMTLVSLLRVPSEDLAASASSEQGSFTAEGRRDCVSACRYSYGLTCLGWAKSR
jgi:hypothetical protein